MKSILHPTDFSSSAGRALEVAVRLAATNQAALTILHADLLHEGAHPETRAMLGDLAARARRQILNLSPSDTPRVEPILTRGILPDEAVLDAAKERKTDLIVTGTHGRRGLSRLVMGSTAERLLRKAPCQMLTVRADAAIPDGIFRTLLVPTDLTEPSQRAVDVAAVLADAWDARVLILHVVEPPPPMYYAGNVTSRFELDGDLRPRIEERLHALAAVLPGTSCKIAEGHPAAKIAREADDPAIDLIVMSASGAATIDWLPIGSTTARVCRVARKPVLVTR